MYMTDFEYASYEEQQRSKRAEEAYRAHIIRKAEIVRKNTAKSRLVESIRNIGDSIYELLNPTRINRNSTSYGSYTSTSCY